MFTVLSVEMHFLILQRVTLVAEQDFNRSVVAFRGKRHSFGENLSAYPKPVRLSKGELVRAIVFWSPIWRVGARLSAETVLQRI